MESMTGYGTAEARTESARVHVEVKVVNGRYLKLHLKAPGFLAAMEKDIEKLMTRFLRRGSAHVGIYVLRSDLEMACGLNEVTIRHYQSEFDRLGLDKSQVMALPGVLLPQIPTPIDDELKQLVMSTVEQAAKDVVADRQREGLELAKVLHDYLFSMNETRARMAKRAPEVVSAYHANLKERLTQLLEASKIDLDEATLAREVAVFAEKADISEELARLATHAEVAQRIVEDHKSEDAGKRLDFLCQELLRETNTVGSKSNDAALTQAVLEMKLLIDRFREQVANVR